MSAPYIDPDPDPVRWFDGLGQCCGCKRPATGVLKGPRNESYGRYCLPCATRRLNLAEKARAAAKARAAS